VVAPPVFGKAHVTMTSYTITITPEGADGTTTTVRMDVNRGVTTLTDVHLHAGTGLSAGQLPAIDYAMLLTAVGQDAGTAAKPTAARKSPGRGRQPRTRRTAPAAAESAKATRARVAAKKTARTAVGGGRAYRRMPDDLAEVFARTGGASAVADHYGVPRHTVQGWLRRLRDQGVLATR
jgi:hypothetical protein